MEGRFEITVLDRKTGKLAEVGGLKGYACTDLGFICARVASTDEACGYLCARVSDESPKSLRDFNYFLKAIFNMFGGMCKEAGGEENAMKALVSSAYTHWLIDMEGKKKAAFILHGLSLIPGMGDREEA